MVPRKAFGACYTGRARAEPFQKDINDCSMSFVFCL